MDVKEVFGDNCQLVARYLCFDKGNYRRDRFEVYVRAFVAEMHDHKADFSDDRFLV